MDLPEAAQQLMGRVRQRDEAIPVALGVADVHACACRIDIAHLQSQPFAQAQSQAVEREEEHPVTHHAGGGKQPPGLGDGDDVGQPLALRGLDQAGRYPRLAQHMGVVELQPIQVELDRTPRVRRHQFGEVVRQLLLGELVDVAIEPHPDPPNRTRVRFDRLRLQPLELQMLQVQRVAALEILSI